MYKSLIQNINELLRKEKVQKEERFKRGEDFNIFRVMHMESDEVYTHSAVIAELLNPKGSHGCGDTFLKLFLELLPSPFDVPFDTQNATTEVEVVIGEITDKEGGRMDVLIESKGQAVIIENKIYAGDQQNQLLRYYNYAKDRYKKSNYKLLYLTLDGKSPSDSSKGNLAENEDFHCISYAGEIRHWLTLCIEKAVQKPLVRETLNQYINLINKLTRQDMESSVQKELKELCSSPQNMEALLWITNNFTSIVQNVMESTFTQQLNEIAKVNGFKPPIIKNDGKDWLNTKWMSFSFRKDGWSTFEISFEFQFQQMRDCISGFRYIAEDPSRKYTSQQYINSRDVFDALRNMDLPHKVITSQRWPIYHYFPAAKNNWISEDIMTNIIKGTLKDAIQKELLDLAAKAEGLKINL